MQFGDLLDKTNKKLQEIGNTMAKASTKTRVIQRKLKDVVALPVANEDEFYGLDSLPISDSVMDSEDYNVTEEE